VESLIGLSAVLPREIARLIPNTRSSIGHQTGKSIQYLSDGFLVLQRGAQTPPPSHMQISRFLHIDAAIYERVPAPARKALSQLVEQIRDRATVGSDLYAWGERVITTALIILPICRSAIRRVTVAVAMQCIEAGNGRNSLFVLERSPCRL
jgi:hypothetical protein